MKIIFICGSLEPGRDGVGDYSRRLAGELIRQGHFSTIIALNDLHVANVTDGDELQHRGGRKSQSCSASEELHESNYQTSEGIDIPILRLPRRMSWSKRIQLAKRFIDFHDPDWLSHQFVPYSFHPKGLPLGLPARLKILGEGRKWHVMFHELCIGLHEGSTLKDRAVGFLQKSLILRLLRKLRVSNVHSSCEPYLRVLKQWGISTRKLRLFANMPVCIGDGHALLNEFCADLPSPSRLLIGGTFGAVFPEWPADIVLAEFVTEAYRLDRQPLFLFIGNINRDAEWLEALRKRLQNRVKIVATGGLSEADVSQLLQILNLGFAASPLRLIEKSSAAAAFREHGVPVVVHRDEWKLRGITLTKVRPEGVFETIEEALLGKKPLCRTTSDLQEVASQLVNDLQVSMP